jgi:hypothetical protein
MRTAGGHERRARLTHFTAWNVAFRTAHIGFTAVLFGGHIFGVVPERLLPWLYLAIGSGAALSAVEGYPDWLQWSRQGDGMVTLVKVLLLCLVPWMWNQRVLLLAAVVVLGSVGSHMPRRLRHYDVIRRCPGPE